MNKKFFVGLLAGAALTLLLAGSALGAQALVPNTEGAYAVEDYGTAASPKLYQATQKPASKYWFSADDATNYPYELYLPNETSPASYRIHSNYTKNTDACASCHATHTAVGASLLQWYSVYETCMACHDGTVSTTYDVASGNVGNTGTPTYGGHFGFAGEQDLSSHNVVGAVEIAAAPGGSVVAEEVEVSARKKVNMWGSTFGCESCHSPHGQGGNARILHPDPNGWATYTKKGSYFVDADDKTIVDSKGNPVTLIKGYPYQITVTGGDSGTYTFNNTPGYTVMTGTYVAGMAIKGTAAIEVEMAITDYLGATTGNEEVKHVKGINSFCGACHVDYDTQAQVAVNGADTIMGEAENRPGYGSLTGRYSQAHRHAVGVAWNYGEAADSNYIGPDKLMATMGKAGEEQYISCLTCHFAHGTSQEYWMKWTEKFDGDVGADKWGNWLYESDPDKLTIDEISGSSALKRLPNMATCEACHQKGDAAQGYNANAGQIGFKNSDSTINDAFNYNSALLGSLFSYADNATASEFETLILGDGNGFFNAEKYVGSEACQSCHKDYYEGWKEEGHSRSFADRADTPYQAFGADGTHTASITDTTYPSYKIDGSTTDTFSWTVSGNGTVMTYDYYTTAGNGEYTKQGTATVNIADLSNVWVDHYVVDDLGNGQYARVASVHEKADGTKELAPYIGHGKAVPSKPSNKTWASNDCLGCHAPKAQQAEFIGEVETTIGCETCHGPASRHASAPTAANIFNPGSSVMDVSQQVNFCGACHSSYHNKLLLADDPDTADLELGFKSSAHFGNPFEQVGCMDCHDVHKSEHGSLLKLNAQALCASCHDQAIDIKAYFEPDVKLNHSFEHTLLP